MRPPATGELLTYHHLDQSGTLVRPGPLTGRWTGHLGQWRVNRRRLTFTLAAAVAAGAITVMALTAWSASGERSDASPERGMSSADSHIAGDVSTTSNTAEPRSNSKSSTAVPDGSRVLALDRATVRLPVTVDDQVELIGLVPTVEAVRSEVVADNATVMASTDDVVIVIVTEAEAHRAVEIAAVGSLVVLGLTPPSAAAIGP